MLQLGQFQGDDGLFLYSASATAITRTQLVSHHHYLRVNPGMMVTFSYSSSLGSNWNLYWGTLFGPDVGSPITGPEWVNATGAGDDHVWAVTQVPASAADGPHTLYLTASSGMTTSTATDLMWVGDWVAPAGGNQVYLPTLIRN